MDNPTTQVQWYDKTWLVIILCILFFPIGLYALWKNQSISKGGKIGGTVIIAIIVIISLGNEKDNSSKETIEQTDSILKVNDEKKETETFKNQQQLDFVKLKSDLYQSKYVNANNEAQKSSFQIENKKLTKLFFEKHENRIVDWVFIVEGINLSHKPSDTKLLKQGLSPNQVIEKDPTGRNIDFAFTAFYEDEQYVISVTPTKSTNVNPSDPLYEKLMNIETGTYVYVSGIVMDLNDYTSKVENGIMLGIKLTDISEKLD